MEDEYILDVKQMKVYKMEVNLSQIAMFIEDKVKINLILFDIKIITKIITALFFFENKVCKKQIHFSSES